MARSGRLESAEDIFFLTLPETWPALAGQDLRPVVSERRAVYDRELKRRHVPRILLSDGTEPTAGGDTRGDCRRRVRGTPARRPGRLPPRLA